MSVGLSNATSNKNTLAPTRAAPVSLLTTIPSILLANKQENTINAYANILKLWLIFDTSFFIDAKFTYMLKVNEKKKASPWIEWGFFGIQYELNLFY